MAEGTRVDALSVPEVSQDDTSPEAVQQASIGWQEEKKGAVAGIPRVIQGVQEKAIESATAACPAILSGSELRWCAQLATSDLQHPEQERAHYVHLSERKGRQDEG